jgi:hypothetical protein
LGQRKAALRDVSQAQQFRADIGRLQQWCMPRAAPIRARGFECRGGRKSDEMDFDLPIVAAQPSLQLATMLGEQG